LLAPDVRASRERLDALLTDDFAEFGTTGLVYSKAQVLDQLPGQPAFESSLEQFALRPLAPDVVLAAYRRWAYGEESLRTSIWRREGDCWRMAFHQGTVVPPAAEPDEAL
jgi:hypothetical protein